MSETILIKGGRVLDPAAKVDGLLDVLVEDGVVAKVEAGIERDGARVLDAAGCIVTPGFVDLHAHLREPGFEHKGTIATETEAALRGGFTTVLAMPNTDPAPDSAAAVESLLERAGRDARVRVLPIGCVTKGRAGGQLAELSELAEAGCVAFSDDGSPVADGRLMRSALEIAGSLGLVLSEHSDDPVLNGGGVMNEGVVSERLGLRGQPAAAEETAVARNVALAEATGAHVHIAHISTARSLAIVADAKRRGLRVTCEVTPSHLFLTEETVFGPGAEALYDTNAKIHPPLRTEADRQALVEGVNTRLVDAIATDHAPHAIQDKLCEFDYAAPGISCFETALATVGELAARGELEWESAIEALTATPAAIFGLERWVPGIGTLTQGVANDVTVFEPDAPVVVDASAFASKGKNTPLDGRKLTGRIVAVIAGGKLAHEEKKTHA